MFCMHCGKENRDDYKYCIACGQKLRKLASILNSKDNDEAIVEESFRSKVILEEAKHGNVDDKPADKTTADLGESEVFNEQKELELKEVGLDNYNQDKDEQENNDAYSESENPTNVINERYIKLIDDNGKKYEIDEFPSVVGKSKNVDTTLVGYNNISREHIKIHVYGIDKFVVENLESINKTYINGYVLEPNELVVLDDGDVLKLGKTEFTVRYM